MCSVVEKTPLCSLGSIPSTSLAQPDLSDSTSSAVRKSSTASRPSFSNLKGKQEREIGNLSVFLQFHVTLSFVEEDVL